MAPTQRPLAIFLKVATFILSCEPKNAYMLRSMKSSVIRSRNVQWQQFFDPPGDFLVDMEDSNQEGCGSHKNHSCSPSASPSIIPSGEPTSAPSFLLPITFTPTNSMQPSVAPTISRIPTSVPSTQPSFSPSDQPSMAPSSTPSIVPTNAPTITSEPTTVPSMFPSVSLAPTQYPTTSQVPTVSPAPSLSAAPTVFPSITSYGVITRIITNPNGETGVVTSCRLPVPEEAYSVVDQAVIFDYMLKVVGGSDAALAVDFIATRLHSTLSATLLTCQYSSDSDFNTYALTSLPKDILNDEGCQEKDSEPSVDCYLVNAALVSQLFYLVSRRNLQVNETITDSNVAEAFSMAIEDAFVNGGLHAGFPNILGAEFLGLTNDNDNMVVPVDEKSRNAGVIAGSTLGTIAGVAIIVAIIVFAVAQTRRKNDNTDRRKGRRAEALEVGSQASMVSNDDDTQAMLGGDKSILSDDGPFSIGIEHGHFTNDDRSVETAYLQTLDAEEFEAFELTSSRLNFVEPHLKGLYKDERVSDTVDF